MFKIACVKGFFDKVFEVKTDGVTIWVNYSEKCVARFSEDSVTVGVSDFSNNIFNRSKSPMGLQEWTQFRRLMHDCYGFSLGDDWKPSWLQKYSAAGINNIPSMSADI